MTNRARAIVPVDYEDMKTGFQSGKAAALSDWAFRKENAEFEKVVTRLRAKKWAQENPERRREIALAWARRPENQAAKVVYIRDRRHRLARRQVFVCANRECDIQWCRVPGGSLHGNKRPIYCSPKCLNRERYLRRLATQVAEANARAGAREAA